MKKYKTKKWGEPMIEVVEVDRETESSVWINGRRKIKFSDWDKYHASWEDAHAYLMDKAEAQVDSAHDKLNTANRFLINVKGLKTAITEHE